MAMLAITCPHCATALALAQEPPAGAVLRCQKCSRYFNPPGSNAVTAHPTASAHTPPPTAATAMPTRPASKTRSDTVPVARGVAPPPRSLQKQRPSAFDPRWLVAATLLILLLGGSAAAYFLLAEPAPTQTAAQPTEKPVVTPARQPVAKREPVLAPPAKVDPAPVAEAPATPMQEPLDEPLRPVRVTPKPATVEEPTPASVEVVKTVAKPKVQDQPVIPIPQAPAAQPANPAKIVLRGTTWKTKLTPAEEMAVNATVLRGVLFLRKTQQPMGTWAGGGGHAVGHAAMPALTLLECGVSPADPGVQGAAAFVRKNSETLTATYELALAILFLDKLGNPNDRALIQILALRLVAGQTANGGWSYQCPLLSRQDSSTLLTYLHYTRPLPVSLTQAKGKLPTPVPQGNQPKLPMGLKPGLGLPVGITEPGKTGLPVGITGNNHPYELPVAIAMQQPFGALPTAIAKGESGDAAHPAGVSLVTPFQLRDLEEHRKPAPSQPAANPPVVGKEAPPDTKPFGDDPVLVTRSVPPQALPPALRELTLVKEPPMSMQGTRGNKGGGNKGGGNKGRKDFDAPGNRDDNSNSQFAIMALWAARRHNVPMERTIALIDQRYQASQAADGGWAYHFMHHGTTPSMTAVGLIGLAMGHGSANEVISAYNQWTPDKSLRMKIPSDQDPSIKNGIAALARDVGVKQGAPGARMGNLYFLWSLERVAMLYDLQTIHGKDWYGWAAEMIVQNQKPDGHWESGQYPGSNPVSDTCMALLVLQRINLVQDLTDNLRGGKMAASPLR